MSDKFSDVAAANSDFVSNYSGQGVAGLPAKKMLLLTCMDCRILPHNALGMSIGDMKVMRNGGGQLNSAVEDDIVVANNILNCDRILIMQHTKCGMAGSSKEKVKEIVQSNTDSDVNDYHPAVISDQLAKLSLDVNKLRNNPLLKSDVVIQGAMYDVDTGKVDFIDN